MTPGFRTSGLLGLALAGQRQTEPFSGYQTGFLPCCPTQGS